MEPSPQRRRLTSGNHTAPRAYAIRGQDNDDDDDSDDDDAEGEQGRDLTTGNASAPRANAIREPNGETILLRRARWRTAPAATGIYNPANDDGDDSDDEEQPRHLRRSAPPADAIRGQFGETIPLTPSTRAAAEIRHFLEELRITLTRAVSDERLPYTLRSVCLTAVNLTALYQVQNVMRMNNDRQVFNENGET